MSDQPTPRGSDRTRRGDAPSKRRSFRRTAAATTPAPRASAPTPAPAAAPPWARPVGVALLALAAVGLFVGWRAFWFLTDDAHIAFRYIAHSRAGHGYVWNAPPFRPVEGYTSFLFVALLDLVWRVTGVAPPAAANPILLLFGYGTLGLAVALGLRMRLGPRLAPVRLPLVGLAALAVVANRTFLAWTSSGLETSMFNFLLTLWIACCVWLPLDTPRGLALTAGAAALAALTRPDGLLAVVATAALWSRWAARDAPRSWRALAPLAPLALVAAHLAWRRRFYGEWVPNTYFAKVAGAWPEAGARYLLSFVLEYALWVWLAVALAAFLRHRRALARVALPREALGPAAAALTVAAHVAYYTAIIGGDHFEYRVFSYTIALLFVSFVWLLGALGVGAGRALALLGAFALLSLPLPWTHWALTRELRTAQSTFLLTTPLAPHFPALARPYVEAFDELQSWLILRFDGVRHQEHKVFFHYLHSDESRVARRTSFPGAYPVAVLGNPGTYSWNVPEVNVIDLGGLSDRVVARTDGHLYLHRLGHDRRAPPDYLHCFRPNVTWAWRGFVAAERDTPLTARDIRACESTAWRYPLREPDLSPVAAPDGWLAVQRELFGHPTPEGLTFAIRMFGQLEAQEAHDYAMRYPSYAVIIPRASLFRVLERDWIAGRVRIAIRGRAEPLWAPSEILP